MTDKEAFEQLLLNVWGPEPLHPAYAQPYIAQKEAAWNWFQMGLLQARIGFTDSTVQEGDHE